MPLSFGKQGAAITSMAFLAVNQLKSDVSIRYTSKVPHMRTSMLFVVLLTIVLSGCATTGVPTDYMPSESSGKGVVVTSITYSGMYSGYSVRYASRDGKTTGKFMVGQGVMLIPYFPDMDIEEKGMKGNVVAAELPAGQYEINGWQVSSGYTTIQPTSPVQIHFTVEPGKRLYLGNFHFEQTQSMGLTVTGVKVGFSDQEGRDMNVVAKKYPNVAISQRGGTVPKRVAIESLGGVGGAKTSIPIFLPTYAK
jgi:hypothetical protein